MTKSMKHIHTPRQRIATLKALIAANEISVANGATPQFDDQGNLKEDIAICGTCGKSWNDALITERTPAPSARCPYESIHSEIRELKQLIKKSPKPITTKRIHKVTIKYMPDSDPDTSYLGEYSNRATSEFSIDREHSLDCPVNTGESSDPEISDEPGQCNCSGVDLERNQYRFFNPSFNYVDKNGHALKGSTPEDVRKYVRQDYEHMERLNRGDWIRRQTNT